MANQNENMEPNLGGKQIKNQDPADTRNVIISRGFLYESGGINN